MTNSMLEANFSFWVSAALLLTLLCAFRTFRIDSIRDRLFAIRDEMFLYAYDHDLLDSPAHEKLRALMNGFIRYAHRLSMFRLVALTVWYWMAGVRITQPAWIVEWEKAIDSLPSEQSEKFRTFHVTALNAVLAHLVSGSILMWVALVIAALYLLLTHPTKMLLKQAEITLRDWLAPLETEAVTSVSRM